MQGTHYPYLHSTEQLVRTAIRSYLAEHCLSPFDAACDYTKKKVKGSGFV